MQNYFTDPGFTGSKIWECLYCDLHIPSCSNCQYTITEIVYLIKICLCFCTTEINRNCTLVTLHREYKCRCHTCHSRRLSASRPRDCALSNWRTSLDSDASNACHSTPAPPPHVSRSRGDYQADSPRRVHFHLRAPQAPLVLCHSHSPCVEPEGNIRICGRIK